MPGSWSDFLKLRSGPAPPPSSEAGSVRVYADADGALRSVQSDGTDAPIGGGGGGSMPSAVVRGPYLILPANFAALANGVAFYTPTVGDILLDAWFETDSMTISTPVKADLSQYTGTGSPYGLFSYQANPVDLGSQLDTIDQGGGPLQGAIAISYSLVEASAASAGSASRLAPARFVTADPLLVVVSQNGQKGGTACVGTAGSARLYIITATPVGF